MSKLGDLISVEVGNPNADFWVVRRGSADTVGTPTRTFSEESYGITVKDRERLDSNFLFYMFQYVASQGYFKARAKGSLKLVNIIKNHITDIPLEG